MSVATAGINSSGHSAIEAFTARSASPTSTSSYDGGNPAVNATVAGETEVTTQLAVEQAAMIRAKRLRPLAVLSDKPLELEGFGTIPPVTASVAGLQAGRELFRHLRPQGRAGACARDRRHGLEERGGEFRHAEEIRRSAMARNSRRSTATTALKAAMPAIQSTAWQLHAAGKSKVSPDTVGIAKP